MTGRTVTQFQQIANSKGWTFEEIAKRWGKSERQLSRIAKAAEQRDMDAVNGLPDKNKTM
jgi:transcriptional regulator